jgi:hypothetical protein
MTCTHCGNYVAEGSAVCPTCGTQMAGSTGSAPGAPSWASASGPTDDRMDPSTPAWSPPAQPPTAPLPSWSPSGQQPGAADPSWSPSGQQANAPGQPWSPSGQQPGAPGPSWSPAGGAPGGPAGPPANNPGPSWGQPGGQPGQAQGSSAFAFDAKRWKRSDWVTGIASLVVLISLFLPWFDGTVSANNDLGLSAQSASESGTAAHGWLWLVFIISLLILAFLVLSAGFRVLPFKLPLREDQVLLIATGVNLLLVFIAFLLKPSTDGIAGVSISWSIGAFLALVAGIVAVAALTPPGRQRLDSSRASLAASSGPASPS